MIRILIIGAGSFIGTNYIKYSRNKQISEVSLKEKKPEEIDFRGYDVVLHLAAIVHQSKKISEQEYNRVNRDMCLDVAKNAKRAGVKQFVFLSTLKVYGKEDPSTVLRNEDSECHPDDFYGKSKYEAEVALKGLSDSNFIVSIIRTPLVYGEGVRANMMSLIRLVDSCPILPLGGIKNKRNFTFSENLVGFIDRIIEKQAQGVFIAMDSESLSTTGLVNCISESLGKKVYLFRAPGLLLNISRVFLPTNYDRLFGSMEFENRKTRKLLDYEAPFSTQEGIKKTVNYYLDSKETITTR